MAQVDLLHIPGEAHHGDDGLPALNAGRDGVKHPGALLRQRLRLAGGAGEYIQFMPRSQQVPCHGQPHDAYADKSDFHYSSPLCASGYLPLPLL